MSYIISVVVLEPKLEARSVLASLQLKSVVVQPACQDGNAKWRACYLDALWRRLGRSHSAFGVYVLMDTGGGYLTSSPFVDIPEARSEPARLRFPPDVKDDVAIVLETLLSASSIAQILVICEPTFAQLGTIPEHRYDNYDIADAISLNDFWLDHDLGMLLEEHIYGISG